MTKQQETKWIPVTERLPEENSFVLVTIVPGTVTDAGTSLVYDTLMAHYSIEDGEDKKFQITGFGDVFLNEEVIAWQPLPEPYEEDEE